MMPIEDQTVFDWIARGRIEGTLRANNPDWSGNTVRHLMPDVFETYAKIFHRLDVHYENIDNPLSDEEIAVLKIPSCASLRALAEQVRERGIGTRVRWCEVADLFGFPFVPGLSDEWFRARLEPGCWPRYIYGPGEGYLEEDEYMEIASLLSQEGHSQYCFYRLPEIPFVATDQPLLFQGTQLEVNSIPTIGTWNAPEYWWPSNRNWCICSDYDLSFTFVGGTRELISRILGSKEIEAIEVRPDLRVDYFAPMPAV
jgi:hypothetical protein